MKDSNGVTDATTDATQIEAWWDENPDANIGLATGSKSGLFVVDVDGERGEKLLAEMGLPGLKTSLEGVSGREGGGRHLIFNLPDGISIRNYQTSDGHPDHGLDIRGEGGYIVVAPSIHDETGKVYRFNDPKALKARSFGQAPQQLLEWATRSKSTGNGKTRPNNGSAHGDTFFTRVNTLALERLDDWVPHALPAAKRQASGGWRVKSVDLGRGLQEDLSLHPDGGRDFGREKPITPIDVVTDFAGISSPVDAALWICKHLGVDPATLGWEDNCAYADASTPAGPPLPGDWPDPIPLPSTLPRVDQLDPHALLPASVRPWIVDIAERMQCPVDYPAAAAMVALGAVIGRQVSIRPKVHDTWTVIANLWGAIVGRPGMLKSPVISEVFAPLKALEQSAAERHELEMLQWKASEMVQKAAEKIVADKINKALKGGGNTEAEAIARQHLMDERQSPVRQRYITTDPTVEKLAVLFAENPRGILYLRDELMGWLRNMEREGRDGDREFYLECWAGDVSQAIDRVGRGLVIVPACCLSVFGGVTPGPFQSYMIGASRRGANDDGLIQRIQLLVWPDISPDWINVDAPPSGRDEAHRLFGQLNNLKGTLQGEGANAAPVPYLKFNADAQSVFNEWLDELEPRLKSGKDHPHLMAHLSKFRSLMPSLALISHLAEGGRGPIGPSHAERAAAWLEYLESHAKRIYSASISPEMTSAQHLADRIMAGEIASPFCTRDVYRNHWTGLATPAEADGGIRVLSDYEWIRPERVTTGGRPTTIYHINPRVGR
jgi:putative DNA primase/helicase